MLQHCSWLILHCGPSVLGPTRDILRVSMTSGPMVLQHLDRSSVDVTSDRSQLYLDPSKILQWSPSNCTSQNHRVSTPLRAQPSLTHLYPPTT